MKDFYNKKYNQIKRKTPLSEYEIHVSKHVSILFMRVFNGIFMILFYNYFAKTTNTHNYFNLNLSSEYLANRINCYINTVHLIKLFIKLILKYKINNA